MSVIKTCKQCTFPFESSMRKQTFSFVRKTFNQHITDKSSSLFSFTSPSSCRCLKLHKQMILYAHDARQNFFCKRAALQYVNDNLLRKEMKNGAVFKCDVKEGTLLFICNASGNEKKRSALGSNDEVRCSGLRL